MDRLCRVDRERGKDGWSLSEVCVEERRCSAVEDKFGLDRRLRVRSVRMEFVPRMEGECGRCQSFMVD